MSLWDIITKAGDQALVLKDQLDAKTLTVQNSINSVQTLASGVQATVTSALPKKTVNAVTVAAPVPGTNEAIKSTDVTESQGAFLIVALLVFGVWFFFVRK